MESSQSLEANPVPNLDNQVVYKLLEDLRQQCRFGQFAFQNLRANLGGVDSEKVFFFVQALLSHALHASKFLWPDRESSRVRGEKLRAELKVNEASPLRLRGLRRQLEHYDEGFEDWLASLERPSYVDMNIMPMGTMAGFKSDVFQHDLDPDTGRLVFRGETADLRQLNQELRQLETAVQTWFKNNKPW